MTRAVVFFVCLMLTISFSSFIPFCDVVAICVVVVIVVDFYWLPSLVTQYFFVRFVLFLCFTSSKAMEDPLLWRKLEVSLLVLLLLLFLFPFRCGYNVLSFPRVYICSYIFYILDSLSAPARSMPLRGPNSVSTNTSFADVASILRAIERNPEHARTIHVCGVL